MEGEGGVPVEAEAPAGLVAGAGGHGGVGYVEDLVGVVDVGNGVGAGVGREGGLLVVVAGDGGVEAGVATSVAAAERVSERDVAAGFLASLGSDGAEEEEEGGEKLEYVRRREEGLVHLLATVEGVWEREVRNGGIVV